MVDLGVDVATVGVEEVFQVFEGFVERDFLFAEGERELGLRGEEGPRESGVSEVLFHRRLRKMTNNHIVAFLHHRMQNPSQNRPIIRQMRRSSLFLKDGG